MDRAPMGVDKVRDGTEPHAIVDVTQRAADDKPQRCGLEPRIRAPHPADQHHDHHEDNARQDPAADLR